MAAPTLPRDNPRVAVGHQRVYALLAIGLVVWICICLYFVLVVYPTAIYSLSYYGADYNFGFVRRGLAGELIDIFPRDDYFTAAYAVMWVPAVVWAIALAALIWHILFRGDRTERRIMLATLVPVLPFSLAFFVFAPRPELCAMAALLTYSLHLTRAQTPRSKMLASAMYGAVIAVLALMHEAIPLVFALGAILAILVLAKDATPHLQWICTSLAIAPGFVMTLVIAGLGRRDIASQLCAQLPHRMIDNPFLVPQPQAGNYILGRLESRSDYHDFVCNVIKQIDDGFADALRATTELGVSSLVSSFLLGLLIFAATIWVIGYFSGVPLKAFRAELQDRLVLPSLALVAWVPLFMTGCDWTRWWVLLTFDVAIVYLLYALGRPEIAQAPSRKTFGIFVAVVIVLALPIGQTSHIGGPAFPTPKPAATTSIGVGTR